MEVGGGVIGPGIKAYTQIAEGWVGLRPRTSKKNYNFLKVFSLFLVLLNYRKLFLIFRTSYKSWFTIDGAYILLWARTTSFIIND